MSEIWTLVRLYYTFCGRPNMLTYIADLLYKDKYLCDDIKNMNNWGLIIVEKMYLTKLQVWGRFWAPIIVKIIVIVFYKATYNAGLAFNLVIIEFFNIFCTRILAFLFGIVYYGISKY